MTGRFPPFILRDREGQNTRSPVYCSILPVRLQFSCISPS
jgi:hypothetical protein